MNARLNNILTPKAIPALRVITVPKAIAAFSTVIALALSPNALAGEKVDKTIETSSSPKLDIEHVNGSAEIKVWDKSQVRVVGELGDRTEEFVFEKRGDVVVIHVEVKRKSKQWYGNNNDGDELTIYAPIDSDLHYTAVNADVIATGIQNAVDIEVVNGDVTIENSGSHIEVESVNGDIELLNVVGDLDVETVNGDIEVTHTGSNEISFTSVNGDLDVNTTSPEVAVETVNGRIELTLAAIDRLEIDTVNGKTTASMSLNDNGQVKANSVGGAVSLAFQQGVSAQFDIEAHAGGNIKNNISDDEVKKPKYGPSRWLRFIQNGGSANVDISTVHGRIEIDEK